jgi:hypothetical protein
MATLLESLQKRLAQSGTTLQPPAQPQQQAMQQALQAGTGKVSSSVGFGSARQSSLGEQSAIATAEQQALQQQQKTAGLIQDIGQQSQAVEQKETLAGEQLQAQRERVENQLDSQARVARQDYQDQEEQARARRDAATYIKLNSLTQKADQALQQLATQRGVKLDDIFANYDKQQAELELAKADSALNQSIFNLQMSNRAFIDELEMIGNNRQLNSALDFQRETQDIIWGINSAQAREQFDWLRGQDLKARDFERQLSQMGIQSRLAVYDMAMQANQTQFYSKAINQVGQAAATGLKSIPSKTTVPSGPPTAGPGMTASAN